MTRNQDSRSDWAQQKVSDPIPGLPEEILATLIDDAVRTLEQATIALRQILVVLRG